LILAISWLLRRRRFRFKSQSAPPAPATPPAVICPGVAPGDHGRTSPLVFVPASTLIPFGGCGTFLTITEQETLTSQPMRD
jgi:hypothetical protein